nr:MAG TPA: hypothetical protein [Caudoviricetes sp.]
MISLSVQPFVVRYSIIRSSILSCISSSIPLPAFLY